MVLQGCCVRTSQDHPKFCDALGRFTELSIQPLIAYDLLQWRDTKQNQWTEIQGDQAQTFKSPLPVESHGIHLISLATSCDNTHEMLSTKEARPLRKLIRDSVPIILIGGWPHRHPLIGKYKNSRPQEGKQVFSRNHIVCINSSGTLGHPSQFWEWYWCESPWKPRSRCQQRDPFKSGLLWQHFFTQVPIVSLGWHQHVLPRCRWGIKPWESSEQHEWRNTYPFPLAGRTASWETQCLSQV